MRILERTEGYGHLINWIVRIGDLLLINLFFLFLYAIFYRNQLIFDHPLHKGQMTSIIMLINFSYFLASTFIRVDLSSNVMHLDRIVERSTYFFTIYFTGLTSGILLFKLMTLSVVPWILIFLILGALFSFWHIVFRMSLKAYRRRGYNYKQVIIVGGGVNAINTYNELIGSDFGYKIMGFFDDNEESRNDLPNYLGYIADIQSFAKDNTIDEIYCTLSGREEEKVLSLVSFSEKHMIRFYLVPEFYRYIKRKLALKFVDSIPIISLRYEPLQYMSNRIVKRSFDLIFSSIVLVTLFPFVFLIFGTLIKLSSSGPIFFKQKRTGINGHEFYCYKFRSMKINDKANTQSATQQDPRVTKVGQFMRKTSVDELPQFLNVLKGEMSVVGPRPHMTQHTSLYSMIIDRFMVRHLVKPGITGWAQVTGFRGETRMLADMEGRVRKDVWYIENWSFFLDLKIIYLTVYNIIRGEERAY